MRLGSIGHISRLLTEILNLCLGVHTWYDRQAKSQARGAYSLLGQSLPKLGCFVSRIYRFKDSQKNMRPLSKATVLEQRDGEAVTKWSKSKHLTFVAKHPRTSLFRSSCHVLQIYTLRAVFSSDFLCPRLELRDLYDILIMIYELPYIRAFYQ